MSVPEFPESSDRDYLTRTDTADLVAFAEGFPPSESGSVATIAEPSVANEMLLRQALKERFAGAMYDTVQKVIARLEDEKAAEEASIDHYDAEIARIRHSLSELIGIADLITGDFPEVTEDKVIDLVAWIIECQEQGADHTQGTALESLLSILSN